MLTCVYGWMERQTNKRRKEGMVGGIDGQREGQKEGGTTGLTKRETYVLLI